MFIKKHKSQLIYSVSNENDLLIQQRALFYIPFGFANCNRMEYHHFDFWIKIIYIFFNFRWIEESVVLAVISSRKDS